MSSRLAPSTTTAWPTWPAAKLIAVVDTAVAVPEPSVTAPSKSRHSRWVGSVGSQNGSGGVASNAASMPGGDGVDPRVGLVPDAQAGQLTRGLAVAPAGIARTVGKAAQPVHFADAAGPALRRLGARERTAAERRAGSSDRREHERDDRASRSHPAHIVSLSPGSAFVY